MKLLFALIVIASLIIVGCSGSKQSSNNSANSKAVNSSGKTHQEPWVPYADNTGKSNIHSYRIGSDYIDVQFKSGNKTIYRYTYSSAGKDKVEAMKDLAKKGQGLNSYINKNAKKLYEM